MRFSSFATLLAITTSVFLITGITQAAAPAKDAESGSHGDEAATLQWVEQETKPDFIFRQYNLAVLSHYSYLLGSGGEALIVDPARDIGRYVSDAKALGLKITRVYLTHSHADFVAGHMELARATGAEIVVNKATGAKFKHRPVADKDEIHFGKVRCVVLTTPGHTPDGTCLVVHSPTEDSKPRMVLTGDTLFIGSVGRPDLLEGAYSSAQLAAMLFKSWNEKLSKIPSETKIYPAHGAGSLCGAHLSDEPVSTFGEQKRLNPYLQHKDLSTFVMAVIDGLPEAPQYFKHNAAMNRQGPEVVDWSREMPKTINPASVSPLVEKGAWLVDTRDPRDFASGHAPGAINIPVRGRFETWVGIMVPWGQTLVLVGSDLDVKEAVFRLHRIGYDSLEGYVQGGMQGWRKSGLPAKTVTLVSPPELFRQMKDGTAPVIVDVRLPSEWMALRIGQVLNIPLDKLFKGAGRLDPEMAVLMVCNSAYRSSMAAGIMQQLGFKDVRNLEGGSQAWIDAGLPTYGAESSAKAPAPGVYINLPESVSPEELAKRVMDLPGSLDVVDIRPAWQFTEFHIQGAINVMVQDLMTNPAYLNDKRPLIIVCRDGSLSAAVGGALTQKSPRPIRFLSGGMVRYYDEVMRPTGISGSKRGLVTLSPGTSNPPHGSAELNKPAPAPAPAPASDRTPGKARRAGC